MAYQAVGQNVTPQHVAPPEAMANLAGWLKQNASSLNVALNYGGEMIDRTPQQIATFVKGGGVWIDWCGWPMYSNPSTGNLGGGGFDAFLRSLGVVATALPASAAGPVFTAFGVTPDTAAGLFYFSRYLITDTSLSNLDTSSGRPWQVNTHAPFGTLHDFLGHEYYGYSSFALLAGSGAYLYAYGNDGAYPPSPFMDTGVPFAQYQPFVSRIIASLASQAGTSSPSQQPPGSSSSGTQPPSSGGPKITSTEIILGGALVGAAFLLAGRKR